MHAHPVRKGVSAAMPSSVKAYFTNMPGENTGSNTHVLHMYVHI